MKELIINAFEAIVDFRCGFFIVMDEIKEMLEKFYGKLGDKMWASKGIKAKFWEAIFLIIAILNFVLCLPFIIPTFILIDLPYDVLNFIIFLNHWDD